MDVQISVSVSWHQLLKGDRDARPLLTKDAAWQSHRELELSLRPILREEFSEQVLQQHLILFLISNVASIIYQDVPFSLMGPF